MKVRGLRFNLTVLYTATFSVLLFSFYLFAYYLLKGQLDASATNELLERAAGLRAYVKFENGAPRMAVEGDDPEVAFFARTATRYYQIYDLATGTVIEQSPDVQFLGLEFTRNEIFSITEFPGLLDIQTDKGPLRFVNDRLISESGHPYLIQVGISLEPAQEALTHFVGLSFWLLPLGALLATVSGWTMAGRTLSPIKTLVKEAQKIDVSQLHRRLSLTGTGDEIDELAATFNGSFARLEKAVGEMKQFTGSIAHELRTPLASLRGEAEFALLHSQSLAECKNTLVSQIEVIDRLSSMIRQLLTLARAESGELQIVRERVDVSAMLKETVDTFALLASEKGLTIRSDSIFDLTVLGDRSWLERALFNLVDNAIKYTPGPGLIEIRGRREAGGAVVIDVRDSGRGISPEALPHICERFYRADESRSKDVEGVGLGLSLVKWIVEQHQGTINVRSQPGEGSTFTIALPQQVAL